MFLLAAFWHVPEGKDGPSGGGERLRFLPEAIWLCLKPLEMENLRHGIAGPCRVYGWRVGCRQVHPVVGKQEKVVECHILQKMGYLRLAEFALVPRTQPYFTSEVASK